MDHTEGQWTTGLYDCCEDRSLSSGTAACIFAALKSVHCAWLYTSNYRAQLRALYKLPEAPCGDTVIHCCCCICATSQEYRELKNRGVDPSIGWEGNVDKWKQEGAVVPPFFPSNMAR
ncbi:protein PLANT CADMIUM RESISTANCE 9 [Striga asiatica]|uniref:Protein PLANT CADMIUM RESISTANCE 9 n=1 Tax=Striga asiatica TaxID=4170 RepID=A0A5A7PB15_STRAF|nr:protein PLANT CADMIUM RESISTANCE 9 [Striga asiatica]